MLEMNQSLLFYYTNEFVSEFNKASAAFDKVHQEFGALQGDLYQIRRANDREVRWMSRHSSQQQNTNLVIARMEAQMKLMQNEIRTLKTQQDSQWLQYVGLFGVVFGLAMALLCSLPSTRLLFDHLWSLNLVTKPSPSLSRKKRHSLQKMPKSRSMLQLKRTSLESPT